MTALGMILLFVVTVGALYMALKNFAYRGDCLTSIMFFVLMCWALLNLLVMLRGGPFIGFGKGTFFGVFWKALLAAVGFFIAGGGIHLQKRTGKKLYIDLTVGSVMVGLAIWFVWKDL